MKNYILTYNQINESNELDDLSFDELGRLVDLGLLSDDFLIIYEYVKNGSAGYLLLPNTEILYLPNWLAKVNGDLYIPGSNIQELRESLIIKGSIYASCSNLKEFQMSTVFGTLRLDYSQITKLPDNLKVHGDLMVEGIQFEEIPKNLIVNGSFFIGNSNLLQFSNAKLRKMYTIGGTIWRKL